MVVFQITNDLPIMKQVRVYENLCAEVLNENMKCARYYKLMCSSRNLHNPEKDRTL